MRKTDAPLRQAKWLERAAELLVLRNDTLRIIDGAGPSVEADQASIAEPEQTSETQTDQVSSPNEEQKIPASVPTEQATGARSRKKAVSEVAASDTCTFSGVVQISLKRFEESGVALVECPGCGRTGTLSPSGGGLRFKSHDKRKTDTPTTGRRWKRRGKGNGLGCGWRMNDHGKPEEGRLSRQNTWSNSHSFIQLCMVNHFASWAVAVSANSRCSVTAMCQSNAQSPTIPGQRETSHPINTPILAKRKEH